MTVAYAITFELEPGARDAFLALLTPVLDAMRHEATFINAVLHEDEADPDRFMLYETWSDAQDVVEVQIARPYRTAFWDGLPALLRAPRGIGAWRPLRGDGHIPTAPAV
jgi:quinol monooxygenase YgiN